MRPLLGRRLVTGHRGSDSESAEADPTPCVSRGHVIHPPGCKPAAAVPAGPQPHAGTPGSLRHPSQAPHLPRWHRVSPHTQTPAADLLPDELHCLAAANPRPKLPNIRNLGNRATSGGGRRALGAWAPYPALSVRVPHVPQIGSSGVCLVWPWVPRAFHTQRPGAGAGSGTRSTRTGDEGQISTPRPRQPRQL